VGVGMRARVASGGAAAAAFYLRRGSDNDS